MEKWTARKTVRLPGYDYSTAGVYFLTICTKNRKCLLSHIVGTGVLDGPGIDLLPYGKIAAKYINQISDFYDDISVESFVIMPNHIHILLCVQEGPSGTPVPTLQNSTVSRFVSTFKRFCNKSTAKIFGKPVPMTTSSEIKQILIRICNIFTRIRLDGKKTNSMLMNKRII